MNRERLAFCLLAFCGLSVTGSAQEERATPVVTSAAPVERIRFAASSSSVQLRFEVRSSGGALVYDSDWKDGNILDWLPQDSSGQPLAYGLYRLVMRSKNLAGQTSEKQVSLHVDSSGMAIEDQPSASPKITLTAHDGETGELITTSGDLSFRFGDFLNRRDSEAMRLTAAGDLNVNGLIRAKGIVLRDGTILTTAPGLVPSGGDGASVMRQHPSVPGTPSRGAVVRPPILPLNPLILPLARPSPPRPSFTPAFQFVVGDTGVSVGTTNPAYNLDVTGHIRTDTAYYVGADQFASASALQGSTSVGIKSGSLSGSSNSFFGYQAGFVNGAGGSNSFFGYQAGASNIAGGSNAYFGLFAGVFANSDNNTMVGAYAGYHTDSGTTNTAVGEGALYGNTSGGGNIAIGNGAGTNLTIGSNNIDIGNQGVAAEAGTIRIGTSGTQTRAFIAGIRGVTVLPDNVNVVIDSTGQLGTAALVSSRRYKFDINSMGDATDGLMRLRPVTFRYLAHGDNAPLQYGLIAEEVADVYPEMVARNKDGAVETVMYQFLAPMLLNEVQKQHRVIADQERTIDEQAKTVDTLREALAAVGKRLDALEGRAAQH